MAKEMIQKTSQEETIPFNYRPITCLPKMWKLTAEIREEIYYSLVSRELFREEQEKMPQENKRKSWSTVHWFALEKNYNRLHISIDKLAKFHLERPGHGLSYQPLKII